jgi:hypothetical protein
MATEEEEAERGFRVIDRRGRDEDDEAAKEEPIAAEEKPRAPEEPPQQLPAIDFSTFVLSMGTSALYHMGLVGDPESGERVEEPNLPLARQTIDTLAMIETKTRGNLDAEESRLLENLLYELRMRFVEAGK